MAGVFKRGASLSVLACLLVAVLLLAAACQKGGGDDEIVIARIGGADSAGSADAGRSVTLGRLNSAITVLFPGGTEELTEIEFDELKKSLFNEIIEEELVLGQAQKREVGVTAEELIAEEAQLREDTDNEDFFGAIIPRYGTMEKWKAELKRRLIVRKVIREVVSSTGPVSDKDARKYYDENKGEYDIPEQVHALMIVVESAERANEALSRLATDDFSTVAKELSTGPEAKEGGELGFFGKGDMPEEFEIVVFSLKGGDVSGVVETPYGFHIFKVVEKKQGRKLEFEDAKGSIKELLVRDKEDMVYREWMQELKKNSKITIVRQF